MPCAQRTPCKASLLVSFFLTLWDWTYDNWDWTFHLCATWIQQATVSSPESEQKSQRRSCIAPRALCRGNYDLYGSQDFTICLKYAKNTSKSWEKTKWQVHQYQSNLFVKAIREGVGVTIYVKIAKKGWKGSVTSIPSVMRDCGMVSLQFVWIFLAKKPKEKIFINNYIKGGRLSRKRKSFKWEFSLYPHTCKNARTLSVLFSGLLY